MNEATRKWNELIAEDPEIVPYGKNSTKILNERERLKKEKLKYKSNMLLIEDRTIEVVPPKAVQRVTASPSTSDNVKVKK